MALTKKKVKEEVADAKSRSQGNINYIKAGKTLRLRVLEFKDDEGDTIFHRPLTEWNKQTKGKFNSIVDRHTMFGEPDAIDKICQLASENGEEAPYRRRTRYLVAAIDIDSKPHQVSIWALPTTVWTIIAEMAISDEWADVLEKKGGHPFKIERTGSGLDTEYTCTVLRKPFPVSDKLMKTLVDPAESISDPGLEKQCALLGVDVEDLFGDGAEVDKVDEEEDDDEYEEDVEEDEDDDDDETEDDDDEDEDEEEDEDDEEDDEEEDEDDEEEDEDEEVEPEPVKKKKRTKKSDDIVAGLVGKKKKKGKK